MLRSIISTAGPRSAARLPLGLRSKFHPFNIPSNTPLRYAPRRTFTSKPFSTSFTFSSQGRPTLRNSGILQRLRTSFRNFHNTRPRFNGGAAVNEEPTSLGGRLKKLGREYGWSAVGVYFLLSALDFPFCYLLVKYLGTERIGRWEELIVSNVKRFIPESIKQTWHEWRRSMRKTEHAVTGEESVNEHIDQVEQNVKAAEKDKTEYASSSSASGFSWGSSKPQAPKVVEDPANPTTDAWGVEKAREQNKRDASLATQLALAYAIHKSFIFVRVPITAAITPKVVQVLRGWGWDIGKRTTKEAKALKRASMPVKPKARWAGKPKPTSK